MTRTSVVAVAALLIAGSAAGSVDRLAKIPLIFEKNEGQTDRQVDFLSRGDGYTLFLTRSDAVLRLKDRVVRMRVAGAKAARAEGLDALPGTSNYFFDGSREKWKTNIGHYSRVRYANVYEGIDLIYYGKQRQLEYDFVVSPGADPSKIRLQFEGANAIELDSTGDLLVDTLRFHKPILYQEIDGKRVNVDGSFRREGKQVAFNVGAYRHDLPLTIDPVLSYSTYLGGTAYDTPAAIAVDAAGNAYIAGTTTSTDFPITAGALASTHAGEYDIFVVKLNATGSSLLYATFLGAAGQGSASDIAVDASGNVHLTGSGMMTSTPGAYRACNYSCYFVAKISSDGAKLLYLTGSELYSSKIALGEDNSAYVSGTASQLATTVGAFQRTNAGGNDVGVLRLNPNGTGVIFATHLGGGGHEYLTDLVVDSAGNAYLTGSTQSTNFPTTAGVIYPPSVSNNGAFLAKLNPQGTALIYSTMLRGMTPHALAVNQSGEVTIAGGAGANFLPTPGAYLTQPHQYYPAGFLTRLNSNATAFLYATYTGVFSSYTSTVAVDSAGNSYIGAFASQSSGAIPATTPNAFQPNAAGGEDAYIAKFNPTGSILLYATFLGGSGVDVPVAMTTDHAGDLYVAGYTESTDLPTTPGAYLRTSIGGRDAFVAKINNTDLSCAYSLSASTASFTAAVATGTVGVTANSGCVWVATVGGSSAWIRPTSGGSGIGSGVLNYEILANDSTQPRTGTITIAGQTFTISQAGAACTYSIAPLGLAFDSEGGISNIAVTAPQGCTWNAISNANWITISSGQTGYGNGQVRYTVAPSTASRSGTISVAGQTFTITQGTSGCLYSLSLNTQNAAAAGGTFAVALTAGVGCAWTGASNVPWITVTNGTSGTGSAIVQFSVAANTGSARTGTLTIGGQTLTVNQLTGATTCTFSVGTSATVVGYTGLTGTFTLTASGPTCAWTASSNSPWAQVYPLSGTGSTSISYTVFPNFSTALRVATLTVGGQNFSITQASASGTPDQRFIGQMYFNFFGRVPSAAEIAFHLNSLNTGKSRAWLVNAFFNSEEFNLAGRFIAGLYVGVLNRDAEYGGWLFQRNALATGQVDQTSLVQNFLLSAEFIAKNGTPTNENFVRLLYRQILLREPNPAEVTFQAGVLAAGEPRVSMTRNFLNSDEFRGGTGPRLTSFLIHALLLLRDPTPAELNNRITQLQAGTDLETILGEVLASPEFGALLN